VTEDIQIKGSGNKGKERKKLYNEEANSYITRVMRWTGQYNFCRKS
jgi:hypothetical protein